ncbi:MAG: glycosyltransferase family 10 [Mucilaginibacter sp.]
MAKRLIKLHFQNGLNLQSFKKEVWDINGIADAFDFEESTNPDMIIFGPYGNDIPVPGSYIRVGYFCENIKPDLSICEWAFGIPREQEINNPRYARIQWHGTDPQLLVKPDDYNAAEIFSKKKYFCNFLYSHKVPYREEFFKQLSQYKKVDAPGKSMNNMQSFDGLYTGNAWQRKRQFMSGYKFTLAFENDVYPGYQTEKLYDAMQANSIPVYCGDPFVDEVFNTASFINVYDIVNKPNTPRMSWLEKNTLFDFKDIRPAFYNKSADKIKRKIKAVGKDIKMQRKFTREDFAKVINRIIELDKDDEGYIKMLQQPWLVNNTVPQNLGGAQRWMEIFNSIK